MAKKPQPPKPEPQPEPPVENVARRPGRRIVRLVFRPRMLFWTAMAACSIVFVPRLVGRLPDLSAREEYRLPARAIEITALPHYVPPDLVAQVVERAGLPETLSLLDEAVTGQVAAAFGGHPWVAQVVGVRKSFPARIEVELKYRRPAAMVETAAGLYPIDVQGILLPPADFSLSDTRRYPLVENPQSLPQGPAGTRWTDAGVLGAARLAEALAPHWEAFGLKAIRIPNRTKAEVTLEEIIYELVTIGGSRILWGREPESDHPGELSVAQKIGRLQKYRADFGRFDQPHGPYEIDIRHWQEISRRPLAARVGVPRRE